jgi:hypothetical protein
MTIVLRVINLHLPSEGEVSDLITECPTSSLISDEA